MKTKKQRIEKIQDKRAAKLYLEHWQLGEQPNETDIRNNPDYQNRGFLSDKELEKRQNEIKWELISMGYPDPDDIVFDNDAQPLITWKSELFDWNTWFDETFDEEQ